MHAALEPEPHHRVLHHKMRDSYTPNCLTALSVIQGVALADLAVVVGAEYKQFTLVQWLLVVLNFAILITMWDSYMQQSILWEWVPDIRDAAIRFCARCPGTDPQSYHHAEFERLAGGFCAHLRSGRIGQLACPLAGAQGSREHGDAQPAEQKEPSHHCALWRMERPLAAALWKA